MSDQITLDDADRIARACLSAARAQERSISVVVLDARGHEVLTLRDGATWFTPTVARAKAATTVAMGRPSAELSGLKDSYPELFDIVATQVPAGLTSLPGGIPLERDGVTLGAVGVSGALPEQDIEFARAGAAAL